MKSSLVSLVPILGIVGGMAFAGCATGEPTTEEDPTPSEVVPTEDGGGTPDANKPPVKCTPGQCPTGFYNLDGKADGDNCGCEYACTKRGEDDPFDTGFVDANCDGSDGIVNECVYVSTSIGNDGGDGTRTKPYKTIAAALAVAAAGSKKRPVCLSAEKYTEAVELPSGVSLYGGFDQADTSFPFRRSTKHGTADIATVIVAPEVGIQAGTGILVRELKDETHIENLTLQVKIPAATNGLSVYGVRLVGGTAQLFVRKNVFDLGPGNPGAVGANADAITPSTAPNGVVGGGGCSDCSSYGQGGPAPVCSFPGGRGGNGANGSGGTGQPGSSGFGGASGGGGGGGTSCISSNGGSTGTGGNPGAPGLTPTVGGAGGVPLGTIVNGLYVPPSGSTGVSGGNGGGGGGGGGGGSSAHTWPICYDDGGGGGGSGGCGGAGGGAGRGGSGGGSSIGVLVGGSSAVIEANVFNLGNGGTGGAGGSGALGQTGGNGLGGGNGASSAAAGGPGGRGGNGGAGSGGGGGTGGFSVRIARIGTAVVTETTNTGTLGVAGKGGQGGPGGAGAPAGTSGADGVAKEIVVLGN